MGAVIVAVGRVCSVVDKDGSVEGRFLLAGQVTQTLGLVVGVGVRVHIKKYLMMMIMIELHFHSVPKVMGG